MRPRHASTTSIGTVIGTRLRACLAAFWLGSCAATGDPPAPPPAPIEDLATWMEGAFTSTAQAARDPQNFLDVHLSMTRIFGDRDDGPWLYVEQAVATALDRPYRQRVYHLVALDDGRVRSEVYTLPGDPLAFAGAGRDPSRLGGLEPSALVLREGCAIELERIDPATWRGSTVGRGCASNLANASYATSDVVITSTRLTSWDRGFDTQGNQVWGATSGPYEFEKVVAVPDAASDSPPAPDVTESETADPANG